MTRKLTISINDRVTIEEFSENLAHLFVVTNSLLAAYAEMATDSDREAEAEQWLRAASVDIAPGQGVVAR
jgi:hypothetical protein